MKKLIGTVAVAALLATAAFAEISIGGWGRGLWSVFGYDGDARMTHGISWAGPIGGWGGFNPRVGITVAGNSDNVGFVFGLNADGGTIQGHDIAYVWAKPWDFLRVAIGQIQDDTLRVNAAFGQFNWLRGNSIAGIGEDITFRRIGGFGGYTAGGAFHGAEISLTPIEGLYIAAAFKEAEGEGSQNSVVTKFVDVLKQSQYAVGYTIADLLAIKAQYIGGSALADDYFGIINAAVDLLMIENNFISIGAFIPTDFDYDVVVSAAYHGGFDALSLNLLLAAKINDNFGLDIGVGIGYDFGNSLAIEADVRAGLNFPDGGDASGDITIGAFFTKGFANGVCGIGAEVAIPFGDGHVGNISLLGENDSVSVAIPIKVEYWF